jgi:suppressor of ftsI
VYFPEVGEYPIEHVVPGGKTYTLGKVSIKGERVSDAEKTFLTLRTNAKELADFNALRALLPLPPQKQLRLTLSMDMQKIMGYMGGGMSGMNMGGMSGMNMGTGTGMSGMMHASVPIEWEDAMGDMNTFSTSDTVKWIMRDEETGKENMDINWMLPRGPYVKVRITNDPASGHPMQHPIHFHGNRFAVLSENGVPNMNMVWKDTVLLKTGDVVDIILETTNPGKWMAHCHIAEHMHSGMMIAYTIE